MKNHRPPTVRFQSAAGFTLIELLIVITIIALLAALSMGTFQYAMQQSARNRTTATMAAIMGALERYKADNGEYPAQQGAVEGQIGSISMDVSGGLMLYQAITGDGDDQIQLASHSVGASDGAISDQERPKVINGDFIPIKDSSGTWRSKLGSTSVTSAGFMIVDGFGRPFSYLKALIDPNATPTTINGSYDLWSVAQDSGSVSKTDLNYRQTATNTAMWIKNW